MKEVNCALVQLTNAAGYLLSKARIDSNRNQVKSHTTSKAGLIQNHF